NSTMTFSGTQDSINAALNGMIYNPTSGFTGSSTLTLKTSDGIAAQVSSTITTTVSALTSLPRLALENTAWTTAASDAFSSGNYTGGTGWSGNWIESDASQSATAGNVQVVSGKLRITGNSNAYRDVNVGASGTISRLTFDLTNTMSGADAGSVRISIDGGTTWVTLATYSSSTATGTKTIHLPSSITGTVRIQFVTTIGATNRYFNVDNVTVLDQSSGYTNPSAYVENGTPVAFASTINTLINDPDSTSMSKMAIV